MLNHRAFILVSLALLFSWGILPAQKQNNVWCFGHGAGLNFNSGVPVAFTGDAISTDEGCASIADAGGNLLFYTDGLTIWNRNNTSMPNGTGLPGNQSSTQSALIVQQPGSSHLYYVFVTNNGLSYSIVDMNLNGGLGDIVSGSKNLPLNSTSDEKICGTPHANGTDVWVMTNELSTNGFNAYLLTATGLNTTAVHSNTGMANPNNGQYGQMKFTCKGDKVAFGIADQTTGLNWTIFVGNFDNSTGIVSNGYNIQTPLFQTYGVEFSPDGHYLYGAINWALMQFDLNAGSPAAVQASLDTVDASSDYPYDGLQIGPDNRIYVAMGGNSFVSVVNSPNLRGAACNVSHNSVSLAGKTIGLDFPSVVYFTCAQQQKIPLTVSSSHTAVNCHDSCTGSATVNISNGVTPYRVLWQPGGDTTTTINNLCAGSYIVNVTDQADSSFTDTVIIANPSALVVSITAPKTTICANDSVWLTATPGFSTYAWNIPGINSTVDVKRTGTYYAKVTDAYGCKAQSNKLTITVNPPLTATVTSNKVIFCTGDSAQICTTGGFNSYLWNTNDTTACIFVKAADSFYVAVTDTVGCKATSNHLPIAVYPAPHVTLTASDTLFCPADSAQICTTNHFNSYAWNTYDTSSCIEAKAAGNYYVTITDANNCTAQSTPLAIRVYPEPSISIVVQGDTLSSFGAVSYQWYRNDTIIPEAILPVYIAHISGSYTLGITDTNACTAVSNPIEITVTGVSDLALTGVDVYPNPSTGSWQLQAGSEFLGSELEVYDANGQLVYRSVVRNLRAQIDLNYVASGVYLLKILPVNGDPVVQKLIKVGN